MYSVKSIICLLLCLSLMACSSTKQVGSEHFLDPAYTQGYVNEHFIHTLFTPVNHSGVKKALNSDHQLMLSLLNRPMPADQAMMLNFAKQRMLYASVEASKGIAIVGPRDSNSNSRTVHLYAHLIDTDLNAVTITAPPP